MGLTAFALFVVPWMLLAVWLFTLPAPSDWVLHPPRGDRSQPGANS